MCKITKFSLKCVQYMLLLRTKVIMNYYKQTKNICTKVFFEDLRESKKNMRVSEGEHLAKGDGVIDGISRIGTRIDIKLSEGGDVVTKIRVESIRIDGGLRTSKEINLFDLTRDGIELEAILNTTGERDRTSNFGIDRFNLEAVFGRAVSGDTSFNI